MTTNTLSFARCRVHPALLCILFAAFSIGLPASSERAVAASLLDVELVTDGSVKPPGDRIECRVLFLAGEAPATIEVRAFTIDDGIAKPVMAKEARNREEDGRFVLRQTLKSPSNKGGLARASIVVPYDQLAIAMGDHQFGYEITGTRDGKTLFVTATKRSLMSITSEARTQMLYRVGKTIYQSQPRSVVKLSKQANGEIKAETITRESSPQPMLVNETRDEQVHIPNGYLRQVPREIASAPEEDPNKAYLDGLKQRAWVPVRHKVIYFVTNRNVVDQAAAPGKRFGSDVDAEVKYGSCLVNIPSEQAHKRGELEEPGWWGQNPEKYFFIEAQSGLPENDFFRAAGNVLRDKTARGDVLLFIHGYRNTFEFAVLRAAQVAHDVRFPGFPVVFSFPSLGTLSGYKTDEDHAANSVPALTSVLSRLISERHSPQGAAGKIHIVAHSLGNRILLSAVSTLAAELPADQKLFGHVVLAAPDVDVADFFQKAPLLIQGADDVTLYFSDKDVALLASSAEHHLQKRAGQGVVTMRQLFNVDAAKANTSLLGHDYYASNSLLLIDCDLLINQGVAAALRPTIRETSVNDPTGLAYEYWFFP